MYDYYNIIQTSTSLRPPADPASPPPPVAGRSPTTTTCCSCRGAGRASSPACRWTWWGCGRAAPPTTSSPAAGRARRRRRRRSTAPSTWCCRNAPSTQVRREYREYGPLDDASNGPTGQYAQLDNTPHRTNSPTVVPIFSTQPPIFSTQLGLRNFLISFLIVIIYTIILLTVSVSLSLSLSVLLIWGLYRPSSEPIALRNVLKCPTRHTLHNIIRFWHFSSLLSLQKTPQTQFYATVLRTVSPLFYRCRNEQFYSEIQW